MKVYLDNNRATLLDPQVSDAMQPLYTTHYADPAAMHAEGAESRRLRDQAYEKIRASLHATESDTLIIGADTDALHSRLLLAFYMHTIMTGQKNHLILSAHESDAVQLTAAYIASQGCHVSILPLTSDGIVDITLLKQTITAKTALVSITMVDAQSGAIIPMDEVSQICKTYNVPLHTDASHLVGKLPIDVQLLDIDYLTLSTRTMHGPGGTALLFVKAGQTLPNLIQPNHDHAGLVGLGKALELAVDAQAFEMEDVRELRDKLEEAIREIPEHLIITPWALRTANTLLVGFKEVQSETLLWELSKRGIYASAEQGRHIITNISADPIYKHTLIGFALSRYSTEEEIGYTIEKLRDAVDFIRTQRTH